MCSLLCLLPRVAVGQITAFPPEGQWTAVPQVQQKAGVTWGRMLRSGGMVRSADGQRYLMLPRGWAELVDYNAADGLGLGPHAVVGWMSKERQRVELDGLLRFTSDNGTQWSAALRYLSPVEQGVMVELHGGCHSVDFNHNALYSANMALLASAIFGWRDACRLNRRDVGVRVDFPLGPDFDLKTNLSWEQRRRIDDTHNVPRLRDGMSVRGLVDYTGPVDGDMALLDVQLSYQRGRRLYVYDDMTARPVSSAPLLLLRADAGMGRWHYLTLEGQLRHTLRMGQAGQTLQYMLGGGAMMHHGERPGLSDWHHFHAVRFGLQGRPALTLFRGLRNYELSTDRHWLEAHAEYQSRELALCRRWGLEGVRAFAQVHALQVPDHRFYLELHQGWDLNGALRLSWGVAMNRLQVHDLLLTLSVNAEALDKQK